MGKQFINVICILEFNSCTFLVLRAEPSEEGESEAVVEERAVDRA